MSTLLGQQLVLKLSSRGARSHCHAQGRTRSAGFAGFVPAWVSEPSRWLSFISGSPNTVPVVSKMCPSGGQLLVFPAADTGNYDIKIRSFMEHELVADFPVPGNLCDEISCSHLMSALLLTLPLLQQITEPPQAPF